MNDYDDMKYYIDDRIEAGLNSIYDKLQDYILEAVQQHVQEFTGEIMTGEEAANLLGITTRTLYNWAVSGELPRYRIGSKWYWRTSDIIARMDEQSKQQG